MKKFKLLYLSCHSIAEYDEVKLFKEIGLDVFSHGAYLDPQNPADDKRPALPGERDDRLIKLAEENPKEKMSKEFIDNFDIVYSHWMPNWITDNWDNMKHKIVIFRTTGQSSFPDEIKFQKLRSEGMLLVRYSPAETTIPSYAGSDALIRFYKDPNEFRGWNGNIRKVITTGQSLKDREKFCNLDAFLVATDGFPRTIFGPENKNLGDLDGGCLSYENMKKVLRDHRVYFYTGTHPASYTLGFIEALMTGIPVVAIGPGLGNAPFLPEQQTYEIPYILRNGENGFWSDDINTLREWIQILLDNKESAHKIGQGGRLKAMELFGKEKIKNQWKEFFERL